MYKVITAFRGKLLSEHTSEYAAHESAKSHSKLEPIQIWTTSGGSFGLGLSVAHYNYGVLVSGSTPPSTE